MYMVRVSYGDVDDEREEATTEILGTYKTWDEACAAAQSKFDAIKECLADTETCVCDIWACLDTYYVSYGYIDLELGYVCETNYYMVSVVER